MATWGYSVAKFSISLLLTFGKNHQDLVVVENVVARGWIMASQFTL